MVELEPARSARGAEVRRVVLVEGVSDQVAVETLARARARDLGAEGVVVAPLGGATNVGRQLEALGPRGWGAKVAGLCDAGEERFFRRGLESAGFGAVPDRDALEGLGFFVCAADLEDELIRALGADAVCPALEGEGDLRAFRTFQKQPAQRERSVERQLRRFLGTTKGRKAQYAHRLVKALGPDAAPAPLDRLLHHI